jgi:hypothetical protein
MRRTTEAFLSGVVSEENKDFFNQRLSDSRGKLSLLHREIEKYSRPSAAYLDEWIPALMDAALDLIKQIRSGTATAEEKRKLVMAVVKKIQVKQRNQNEITFRLDLVMSYRSKWLPLGHLVITAEMTLPVGYHGPHRAAS